MKKLTLIVLLALIVFAPIQSPQAIDRAIAPANSVDQVRPVANLRLWTFTHKAKDMGRLVSTILDIEEIDGQDALVFERKFNVSYELIGEQRSTQVEGNCYIGLDGAWLGDDLTLMQDSANPEKLIFERDGDKIEGYFTRGGEKVERELTVPASRFGWDPNMLDQLEVFLAMHPIRVGGQIEDSIYVPQSLTSARIRGRVLDFDLVQLYKGKFDSVFVIELSEPQEYTLYFTADYRLVRTDFGATGIRAYQDLVATATLESGAASGAPSWKLSSTVIGRFVVLLVIGALALMLFVGRGYSRPNTYFALGVGIIIFALTFVTSKPLQEWLFAGQAPDPEAMFGRPLMTAALGMIVQLVLILVGLKVMEIWRRPSAERYVAIGAGLGVMMGVLESAFRGGYTADAVFAWSLLEFGALIFFFTAAGAWLGLAWNKGIRPLMGALFALWIIGTAFAYSAVLVQWRFVSVELMYLLMALASVVVVAVTLILVQREARVKH